MHEVVVNESNFEAEVLRSEVPVLVDFWAEWCGPCKVVGPILSEIADEYQGKLKIGKLNVDENAGLTQQYNVLSIPTMKFFKHGQIVGEIVGAAPKTTIINELNKHI
jgi:thioredoxin 1